MNNSMEANSSIIIYLNKQLEVYSFTEAVNKFTVLKILEPNHLGRLELASRFMDFWLELEGWLGVSIAQCFSGLVLKLGLLTLE